jgi:hypothetical protein
MRNKVKDKFKLRMSSKKEDFLINLTRNKDYTKSKNSRDKEELQKKMKEENHNKTK